MITQERISPPTPLNYQQAPIQPGYVVQQPVYLYVPPGHQKDWKKHCRRYNACGQPVYFVKEDWVRERYDEEHGHGKGHGNDKDKKHGKGNKHD